MKEKKKALFFVGASLITVALLWLISTLISLVYIGDSEYNKVGRFSVFLLAFVFSAPTAIFSTLIILAVRKTKVSAERSDHIAHLKAKVRGEFLKVASISNFLVSVYLFVVAFSILLGAVKGRFPSWFIPFVVISPLAIIIYTIGKSLSVLSKTRKSAPEMKEIKREVIDKEKKSGQNRLKRNTDKK